MIKWTASWWMVVALATGPVAAFGQAPPADLPPPQPAEPIDPGDVDADANDTADDDAAALARVFRFRVQAIHLNSLVQLDANGRARHQNGTMTIALLVQHDPSVFASAFRDLTIDQVVTSAGEQLSVDLTNFRAQSLNRQVLHPADANRPTQFNLSLVTPLPQWPATRLRSLVGSLIVDCGVGEPRVITLGRIRDMIGRDVDIHEVPGCRVVITQHNDSQVHMTGSPTAATLIRQIRFLDAEGNPIRGHGWSHHQPGDAARWIFSIKAPEDATVQVEIYPASRSVTVPMILDDIEMPRMVGARRFG